MFLFSDCRLRFVISVFLLHFVENGNWPLYLSLYVKLLLWNISSKKNIYLKTVLRLGDARERLCKFCQYFLNYFKFLLFNISSIIINRKHKENNRVKRAQLISQSIQKAKKWNRTKQLQKFYILFIKHGMLLKLIEVLTRLTLWICLFKNTFNWNLKVGYEKAAGIDCFLAKFALFYANNFFQSSRHKITLC